MNLILMIVSLTSLAVTLAMVGVVVKLLRDERRRSDARVAALTELADERMEQRIEAVVDRPAPRPRVEPRRQAEPRLQTEPRLQAEPRLRPEPLRILDEPEEYVLERTPSVSEGLFDRPTSDSPWPRRLGIAGALAALLLVVALVTLSRSGSSDRPGAAPSVEQTSLPAPSASLELLSLQHSQQADALTITGLVQNPRGGAPVSKVSATAFLFAADGTFLASGRAPLDFTVLNPGEESPFVVAVPVKAPVARYRIGFRGEDGHVIGHIDRRGTPAMARHGGDEER